MATDLGQAYVQIMPSAKGISGKIKSAISPEAESAGTSAGQSLGSKMVGTLAKVLAAAGIGKIIKDSINLGGELEQNLGGTEAVFGSFASNVQKTASGAYKNMGLSASDYMGTANKMGSLFQGSGIDQQRSLQLTSDAMQRAADVASVMGIDTSAAMESIAGAAKGNFTMMDNLGVAMNATTLEAYALEKGINFKWNTASNAEKSELAMKMFMDRTSQYAGNFARESEETFTGALGAMKASFQDLLGNISTGADIGPALENLTNSVLIFGQNLLPMLASVLNQLPGVAASVISSLAPEIATQLVSLAAEVVNTFIASLPTLIPSLLSAFLGVITNIMNGITQALPGLVQTLITAIPELINNLISTLDTMIPLVIQAGVELFSSLLDNVQVIVDNLLPKLPELLNNVIDSLLSNIQLIIDAGITLFTALMEALPEIIAGIAAVLPQLIDGITTGLLALLPMIVEAGITLLVALVEDLPAIINAIVQAIPQIIDAIVRTLTSLIPAIINAGVQLLIALVQNLPLIIATIVRAIPQIISALVSGVLSFVGKMASTGYELLTALVQRIGSAISTIAGKMPQIITGMVSRLSAGISSFASVGRDLIMGLWNGISSVYSWIMGKISGFMSSIISGIKGFFGIKSPSKLMSDEVGQWIPAGIADGIEDNLSPVSDAMDSVGKIAERSFATDVSFTANSAMDSLNAAFGSGYMSKPIMLNLSLGSRDYQLFVDDISKAQDKSLQLQLAY